MPIDEALRDRVRTALGRAPRIQEKRMFGGVTFMVRGKMCVSVGKDRIMCRIDPAVHRAALTRKGVSTMRMKGRDYLGFVHVKADAVRAKRDLDHWVGLALEFNARRKPPARKRTT